MWFTETAWPPMVILSVLAAVSLGWWWKRRQTRALIAALLCVCGIAGSFIVERLVASDRERIEANIPEMAAAFERRDSAGVVQFISPQEYELIDLVTWGFETITAVEQLRITDVSVELLDGGAQARSHFRANGRFHVTGFGDVGHKPTRWELTWQREGDEWKITGIDRLNPITGEEVEPRSYRE